ncbi:MAG: hypothetical protein ACI9XR_001399 [Flavobacterium sp.]|jgi:hypothetical protein
MVAALNNQSFQIVLNTELDLTTDDYIEVFITTNNSNTSSLVVKELQIRVIYTNSQIQKSVFF